MSCLKTGHSEVVRLQYNPAEVSYEDLLNVFWNRHDPTTLNRQVLCRFHFPVEHAADEKYFDC